MADDLLELRAAALKALGQPTRLRILELLRNGERCVCEIFPAIEEAQSNVSRHLAVLRSAGLVASRKEGLNVHYLVKVLQPGPPPDAVVHPAPVAPGFDKPGGPQPAEVPRDLVLADAQGIHQFADAQFLADQEPDRTQACIVRQGR